MAKVFVIKTKVPLIINGSTYGAGESIKRLDGSDYDAQHYLEAVGAAKFFFGDHAWKQVAVIEDQYRRDPTYIVYRVKTPIGYVQDFGEDPEVGPQYKFFALPDSGHCDGAKYFPTAHEAVGRRAYTVLVEQPTL